VTPAEPNAFTGVALDRAGDSRRRDPEWLAAQRAHPGARAVVAGDRGLRITSTAAASAARSALVTTSAATPFVRCTRGASPAAAAASDAARAASRATDRSLSVD
jgi:hypothetical protein